MTTRGVRLLSLAVLFAALLSFTGCASLGPAYKKVESIPEGKGLVYFYRPSSIIGAGVSYDIRVGESPIVTLYSGGYYPYFANPGETEFWAKTESKSSVTLDVKAGDVQYVKGTVGVGIIVGRPHLTVMPAATAETEITDCKLIPEKESK